ncbi:transcription factor WhiB [Streptomyces caniscabiei]|uniref:transcription factor WhiB n=1 Tax=Streptomyces caniscabiei TaxID=2746961 RepID=UPI0018728C13|nr:transcription factor WhiB [Streptomyces caniscabiei]MBE4796177.1 transcription factor WhiB [Streptomyces caniscabiei]MDX2944485.1 transcription factor WhiB [Streptomyces caniscabiei]
MSGGPWRGGITVRGLGRGGLPVADFLCALCLHHRRVTGRQLVRDFLASDPIGAHRTVCTARKDIP